MTVGVAILNKHGVALAVDSAVTISSDIDGPQKVYNSANKLFTISKYHPVGILIYGNADMMGVPWETIIKVYRANLGERQFAKLQDYAEDFIAFLGDNKILFNEEVQRYYFELTTFAYFWGLRRKLFVRVEEIIGETGEVTDTQTANLLLNIVNEEYEEVCSRNFLTNWSDDLTEELQGTYGDRILNVAKRVFEDFPLSEDLASRLVSLLICLFTRDVFPVATTGIAIAGFGEDEMFPCIQEYQVDGVLNNRLRYVKGRSHSVSVYNHVSIMPFAQSEMVQAFMEGIDPNYCSFSDTFIGVILTTYPHIIADQIAPLLEEEQAGRVREALQEVSETLLETYSQQMIQYRRQQHVDPVITTVAHLPKDELASMAEALVNLTSVKHRFAKNIETVGGPVDVAVISKGDGFIWLRRKHYFQPELNRPFFTNYFRETDDAATE